MATLNLAIQARGQGELRWMRFAVCFRDFEKFQLVAWSLVSIATRTKDQPTDRSAAVVPFHLNWQACLRGLNTQR